MNKRQFNFLLKLVHFHSHGLTPPDSLNQNIYQVAFLAWLHHTLLLCQNKLSRFWLIYYKAPIEAMRLGLPLQKSKIREVVRLSRGGGGGRGLFRVKAMSPEAKHNQSKKIIRCKTNLSSINRKCWYKRARKFLFKPTWCEEFVNDVIGSLYVYLRVNLLNQDFQNTST